MDFESFRTYCLSKKGVGEGFPFQNSVMVFKVMGKAFAFTDIERIPARASLKCDPTIAIELRERYSAIQPGYHMNKKHWNTIELEGDVDKEKLLELIDHSYDMVISGLSKSQKAKMIDNE